MSTTTTSNDDEQNRENPRSDPSEAQIQAPQVRDILCLLRRGLPGDAEEPGRQNHRRRPRGGSLLSGAVPELDRGQPRRYDWARSAHTDKGVSAVGQVVSGRFYVDPPGFVERLNSNLSPQIRIFGYKRVTPSFNAKKFCDRRRYVYLIPLFAFDPSCHRDRESVLASVGSGNERVRKEEGRFWGLWVSVVMSRKEFL
ncbi:Pseudouridine synthase family protein [Striga hermonthica]|uniref:Pseudouridine synthase family protein n=1 Tax=Striga hermonthica TaxID=68872 RepID=A0A9N7RIF9_STRHE|nr:Pseudouridine synthase family protein [Striga hermonthica]